MTARAQARQVKGVIIDGRCRDLAEQHEMGFPVRVGNIERLFLACPKG